MPRRRRKAAEPHAPTAKSRREVVLMLTAGMDEDQVAKVVQLSVKELRRIYYDEISYGVGRAAATVAGNLYRMATSRVHPSACQAAIFWMKAKAGWSDKVAVEAKVTNEQRGPDLSGFSTDQLLEIAMGGRSGGGPPRGNGQLH
jgi:hypothetical protein